MDIFKEARYIAVTHILNELRKAKHRVFIDVLCHVMIENEGQAKKADVHGLNISGPLASRIDPDSGRLTLNVSQKACPVFVIKDGSISGSVSVDQMQCNFSIPIGAILAIKDLTDQNSEIFNPFIMVATEETETQPEVKRPNLTLVK
jgi:hypothetical protein